MGVNTARTAITAVLSADETLTTQLTGGIYAVGVNDVKEISRQATPGAFDSHGELLPCALVKLETAVPVGPYSRSARQFLVVYVYQRTGHAVINAVLDQVVALLHEQDIPEAHAWQIQWSDLATDLPEDALNASMGYVRFTLIVSL
jgi:hypothetical protein